MANDPFAQSIAKGAIAKWRNGNIKSIMDFQFNPNRLQRSGASDWMMGSGPGSMLPVATFAKTGEQTIRIDLLFDATENYEKQKEGLRAKLSEAEAIGLPALDRWTPLRNSIAVAPDRAILYFGSRTWHTEILSWDIDETMHNTKLEPLRATVAYVLRLTNPGSKQLLSYVKSLQRFADMNGGAPKSLNVPPQNPFAGGL